MVISLDVSVCVKKMKKHAHTFSNLQACSELTEKKSIVALQDYSPIEPLKRGKILTQKLKLKG